MPSNPIVFIEENLITEELLSDALKRTIRAVANGEAIFGPGITQRLIGFFSASRTSLAPRIFPELTEREAGVLELIAQGRTKRSQIFDADGKIDLPPETGRWIGTRCFEVTEKSS